MKYILGIVMILVVGTVIFITRPEKTFETGKPGITPEVTQQQIPEDTVTSENISQESPVDGRRAAMQMEYDKLTKARKNLEKRLSRLKAVLWDVELPKEQGEKITEQMKNAYALLKNPKMLGAFSGVSEISDELSRVEFVYNNLEGVEESVHAMNKQ
ncbi:MAG: hypothetical protein HY356_04865 [Gammaproteobacteria bacterium]|nr:hypothetical protein [Gammaproteobacteria bacterium]